MQRIVNVVCVIAATSGVAGCTSYDSATNLNPAGPPMVQQVRMKENFTAAGATIAVPRRVFAFGTHPMASDAEVHPVTTAASQNNSLRVIMDELLVGNVLEEIACRQVVDDDAYARVPKGATPDDIARCSVAQDVLPSTCAGTNPKSVCICELDGGCGTGTELVEKGQSVGVLDLNQDGSADDTRFVKDAVGIQCGSINVPIDLDMSYWNPSGNQQPPAQGGFDALGPALVITPQAGLPTNIECGLVFAPDVVDKEGNQVCAPPDGDITADCNPGDTSAFKFKVEPLSFDFVQPGMNNMTGFARTDDVIVSTQYGITLDPTSATATNITITEGGAAFTAFTVAVSMNKNITIHPTAVGGWAAAKTYVVTLPTSIKDAFGQALPAPFVITFSTP